MQETISLRDAAKRLGPYAKGKKRGIQDGWLLSLLRAGQLNAGFTFLAGDQETWIEIPKSYWIEVPSDLFRDIRVDRAGKKPGAYKVRIGRFAGQFIAANKGPGLNAALASALANSDRECDALLLAAEFEAFCQQQVPEHSSKGGRPAKDSWKDVAQILARLVWSTKQYKQKGLVDYLTTELRKAKVRDQPGVDSLEELVRMAAKI